MKSSLPNPCMVDFDYNDATARKVMPYSFSSVEIGGLISQSNRVVPISDAEKNPLDEYDAIGSLFWKASRCLMDYDIIVELGIGCVTQLAQDLSERGAMGLPISFHRVMVSNIPDYTGLLPILLPISPLLTDEPKGSLLGPSEVFSNELFNVPLWQNYRHYVFSSTLLAGSYEAKLLFGLKAKASNGFEADDNEAWEPSDPDKHGLFGAALFHSWSMLKQPSISDHAACMQFLHRLFLAISYPAKRNTHNSYFEMTPMTMNNLLLAITRLIENGAPPHWIHTFLTDVLSQDRVKLMAKPPAGSPNLLTELNDRGVEYVQPVAPARAELGALVSLWSSRFPFFASLPPQLLPPDVGRFIVKLAPNPLCLMSGPSSHNHLGLILGPRRLHLHDLRDSLMSPVTCSEFHMFSVLRKSAGMSNGNCSYYFVASKGFIDSLIKARTHYAVLIRVDDYSPVSLRTGIEMCIHLVK